ncbi:MAG: carbonate dehydratase [Burkholderiales bacterium]
MSLRQLLENNRAWAEGVVKDDPGFFSRLAQQQSPQYLWIGCSDSRVPANQITGLAPGEVFVHRNVANVVVHTDLNCLSVIQFAVDFLKIRHIILCGHYGCSGVLAALRRQRTGLSENWLRHVQDVADAHAAELDAIRDEDARHRRLCELNVRAQVDHVAECTSVRDAWARGQALEVHGWIYDLKDGLLRDMKVSRKGPEE